MKKFKQLLIAIGLVAFASSASAISITGSIGFGGGYTTDSGNLVDATVIQDIDALALGTIDGDFTGITAGTAATYKNIVITPFAPIMELWSIGGFTFDLNSLTILDQAVGVIGLAGNGVIKAAGFDDTDGIWTFSSNSAGSNFTFSASTAAAPEPAITLLLATGLIGFGVTRKMRKKA